MRPRRRRVYYLLRFPMKIGATIGFANRTIGAPPRNAYRSCEALFIRACGRGVIQLMNVIKLMTDLQLDCTRIKLISGRSGVIVLSTSSGTWVMSAAARHVDFAQRSSVVVPVNRPRASAAS